MSQAVAAPNTGDMILASGKSADHASASRRAVLAALAVIPASTAVSAVLAQSLGAAWDEALRRYYLADAAYAVFHANVWNPLQSELERLTPMPPMAVTVVAGNGLEETFIYRPGNKEAWLRQRTVEGQKAGKKLTADWTAWETTYQEHSRRLDVKAIEEEDDRLYAAWYDAEERLMQTPAPGVAAVLTKLEILWGDGRDSQEWNERLVLRDLRLLAAHPLGQRVS